jgi:23S rRNA (uridine2552-2'-O)-methyltransferase
MDFNSENAGDEILKMLQGRSVDVVMSDMAANTVGHQKTDHLRIMALCERSFEFAVKILKPGGHFITKIFRGGTENELLTQVKKEFSEVKHFKPKSSRADSTEIYLIAKNFKKLSCDGKQII